MVCHILRTKGAVLSVWGRAQLADLDEIARNLDLAVAESGGPIDSVSILPAGVPPADDSVRAHLLELMPKILGHCSTAHVVFEGEGFLSAIKRGVLTGLLHATRRQHVFHVHSQLASVLEMMKGKEGAAAVTNLMQLARQRGYLDLTARDLDPISRRAV